MFLSVFEGVPKYEIDKSVLDNGVGVIDLVAEYSPVFASKGEARRMLKDNGVSINKTKVNEQTTIQSSDLINNRYFLIQKGKKNYYIMKTK